MKKSFETIIQPYVDQIAVLGMSIAVIQDGEITYTGAFGKATSESHGIPVTPDTLFAYGSISKNICAALVMRLVEQDLLELDRPVVSYLPGFTFSDPELGGRVTLRHILSHTTGLPMAGKYWGPRDPDSLRRFIYEQIPHYEFLTEPGRVHLYSNTVFCLAGYLAEAVTGKYYDDLVQQFVFDPLDMELSTYDPAVAFTYPMALAHRLGKDEQPHVIHKATYNVSGNPSAFAYGSVLDLAQLAKMYLNQGMRDHERFLSADSVAEMQHQFIDRHIEGHHHPLAHINRGFGLGFNTGDYRGNRTARHGGMNLSFNCFFDLFPDKQAGMVLLTNYSQDAELLKMIVELYDNILDLPHEGVVYTSKPEASKYQPKDSLTGTYLNVEHGTLAKFTITGSELTLQLQEQQFALIPIRKNRFYAQLAEDRRMPVAFLEEPGGNPQTALIWGEPYIRLEPDPQFNSLPHEWEFFAGMYKDPSNFNRDDIFTVSLEGNTLTLTEGSDEPRLCTPLDNTSFICDYGVISFVNIPDTGEYLLKWGKATLYFPINQQDYRENRRIHYLTVIPRELPI